VRKLDMQFATVMVITGLVFMEDDIRRDATGFIFSVVLVCAGRQLRAQRLVHVCMCVFVCVFVFLRTCAVCACVCMCVCVTRAARTDYH
jgi:hypothetical protein